MLNLDKNFLQCILSILKIHVPGYKVWAFGSRVHGEGLKKFSDIDLVVINDERLDLKTLTTLKDAFSDSDLPFKVDIAEWTTLDEEFKKIILENYEVLQ
ncbi:MAG: nucleotidyltransferase domain-containing protein [Candidatus Caenarcaniphilales bacterium]|nr:nucleotidyltransferase domain-containing protein [Candidatus Caenarcaniphilales bacterium]